ncbi:MAG: hypothetical protein ACLGH8_18480 [Bacteroidia bacterium]
MKHTLRCILLLLPMLTFAQAKLKSQQIDDPCKKEKLTFQYDKNGKVTDERVTATDAKGKLHTARTQYDFEKDKITRLRQFSNDTLLLEESSEYMNGDLVHFRRMVKGKLMLDEAYTYKKGQVLKIIATTPAGTLVQDVTYDTAKKIKETLTRSGTVVTMIEREHTAGNTKTIEFLTPPFATPELVKTFVYDYQGNLIDERVTERGMDTKRVVQRFENNIPASKKEFENGKATLEILYDEYGNPLKEQDFSTGEITIYENKFNNRHNLREVKVIRGDNQECIKLIENEYY